jgi:hypothetical protein
MLGVVMLCGNEMVCAERYPSLRNCPDCEADLGFPNVRQAKKSRQTLQARYDEAKNRLAANFATINEFEEAVMQSSSVILTVRHEYLLNFLNSGNSLYLNYHRLIEAGQRVPAPPDDHSRRVESDNAVFGAYKADIIFCASRSACSYGYRAASDLR